MLSITPHYYYLQDPICSVAAFMEGHDPAGRSYIQGDAAVRVPSAGRPIPALWLIAVFRGWLVFEGRRHLSRAS